ncbi:hypothetical protein [Arvimicrobium flavum]|uniref:hypothetical protein n=1 Tax=Arvimicrobium flavum TaxID=3393320 RepID=UPI00237A3783|nr:hypothetical protein [Mesorhizobium shangrilense]
MEFTISQIGSATSHWVARPAAPTSGAVRPVATAAVQPVQTAAATPVAALHDMETEYDQFGRFGATAPHVAERAPAAPEHRPAINATKHLRSGKASAYDLEREYRQSLVDSTRGEGATSERRFIPSGMTEYQVYQLADYQYRWALEVERQLLERDADSVFASSDGGAAGAPNNHFSAR